MPKSNQPISSALSVNSSIAVNPPTLTLTLTLTLLTKNKKIITILEMLATAIKQKKSDSSPDCVALILLLNKEPRIPKKVWAYVKSLLLANKLAQLTIVLLSFNPIVSEREMKKIMPHLRITKADNEESPDIARLLTLSNMAKISVLPSLIQNYSKELNSLLVIKEQALLSKNIPKISKTKSTTIKPKNLLKI